MLRRDYSFTDKVVYLGASVTLAILSVAALVLRYVTDPIVCRRNSDDYLLDRCFHESEIWLLPRNEEIMISDYLMYAEPQTTHHQWIPFALGIGALLCLTPHAIWRMVSGPLLLDTDALLSSVEENKRQSPDRRQALTRDIAILIQAVLKRGNTVLTAAALCRKLLTCVMCVLLMVLVVVLFEPQLGARESDVNVTMIRERDALLPVDPFICKLNIRQYQNVQKYALECILPIAQVYSKCLAFVFYGFLLLALLSAVDIFSLLARVIIPNLRGAAVQRYLALKPVPGDDTSRQQGQTAFSEWLAWDGRLLLALIADCCGPLIAADLTSHLWALFKISAMVPQTLPDADGQDSSVMRPCSAPAAMFATTTAVATGGATSVHVGGATSGHEATEVPLEVMHEREDDKAPLSPRD